MKRLVVCALLAISSLFAEVNVHVSKKNVKRNESITLTFSSDEKGVPDFSPLEQDFSILSRNQSSSTSIINGRIEREYIWVLSLMSKKDGDVVIPAISFGSFSSSPQIIGVAEAEAPSKGDPLYFEVDISPNDKGYERSQLLYTVRFYHSANLYNGRISEPKVSDPDALIEQMGEDKEYKQIREGIRYSVLERTFAIYPQHAGELTFFPVVFEGQVMIGGNSLFNMQTQYTQIESEEKVLHINPIPPSFTRSDWFPAEKVTLKEEWSGDLTKVTAGEPITRSVTIEAVGCLANQIPSIALNHPEDLKQYPDKPKNTNEVSKGVRQLKVALIPKEEGSLTLPEVVVKWWDTKNDRLQESILPAVALTVLEGAPAEIGKSIQPDIVIEERVPLWAWGLISLNGVWFVIFLLGMRKKERKPKESLRGVKKQLKKSCYQNNAKEAEKCLLKWGKVNNLSYLKDTVSDGLREEIEDLQAFLYGQAKDWEGKDLWRAFEKGRSKKVKASQANDLHSLLYAHSGD